MGKSDLTVLLSDHLVQSEFFKLLLLVFRAADGFSNLSYFIHIPADLSLMQNQ